MYRLRTIDRLPRSPRPTPLRGTVVHKVLEDLFDLPAADRTPERAEAMVQDAWEFVLDAEPEAASCCSAGEAPPGTARRSPPGWPRAARACAPTSSSRTRAASSRPSARSTSRRCSTPSCCCAASWTASTSPRTARSVWWTTRPAAPPRRLRGQGAVPDALLRPGHLAHPRRGPGAAPARSTSATGRWSATSPTSRTCARPSGSSRRCGARSRPPGRPASGSRTRAGVPLVQLPGRTARRSATSHRRCPSP